MALNCLYLGINQCEIKSSVANTERVWSPSCYSWNSTSEDAAAEQEGGRPLGFTAVVAECQSKLSDYLPLLCCSVVCWGASFWWVFFSPYISSYWDINFLSWMTWNGHGFSGGVGFYHPINSCVLTLEGKKQKGLILPNIPAIFSFTFLPSALYCPG